MENDKNIKNNEDGKTKISFLTGNLRKTSKNGKVEINKGGSDPQWKNFNKNGKRNQNL